MSFIPVDKNLELREIKTEGQQEEIWRNERDLRVIRDSRKNEEI